MFSMGISARIVKRIITLLIVTLGVVTLSFCLQIFTGTDPAEMLVRKTTLFATEEQIQAMRVELGLDGTLSEQYADYIKGLLTGDLGISITNRKPVIDNIRNALPVTCMLVIMSMLWVAILTVLISAFSVIWKDKAFDHATRVICIIGICVPSFWLALILLIAFAVEIPIFSVISDGSIKSLILPSISIAIPIACISIRVLRAAVINELKSDYVTYAKARGFSTSKIVYGEVLRNAFPSAITLFAQYCASVFGTSALIETVFSIQGLGYYLTEACESMDVYGISGVVLICAILFVLFNTAADIFSGIDVKTVEPEVLLKNYAIVFQNVTLFDESVMENIRLGRSGASDEDVRAAAKAAQCDEFIDRLPQGYDTNIGENGSKLSGGERQRISIARALLKNAPVILLDEATASMDAESETMVQTALSALLKGRTVIVIAHRMRTIANADKIVVLDKGKVTEVGTPSELAKKGGLYAHLVALQQKQQMSSLPT